MSHAAAWVSSMISAGQVKYWLLTDGRGWKWSQWTASGCQCKPLGLGMFLPVCRPLGCHQSSLCRHHCRALESPVEQLPQLQAEHETWCHCSFPSVTQITWTSLETELHFKKALHKVYIIYTAIQRTPAKDLFYHSTCFKTDPFCAKRTTNYDPCSAHSLTFITFVDMITF